MGRQDNPPNPYQRESVEWLGPAPDAKLSVHEEQARTILSRNDSPDLPFTWSINPYRGCYHACAYCYARPSHQYLGYGAGTDFERELVVKTNAVGLLQAAFERPGWTGEAITFSGNTDCYQPLEAAYGLTRGCLQLCAKYRNPVTVITKGALVQRDLDVLTELTRVSAVKVFFSIAFADDDTGRQLEPGAPSVSKRFEAMAALSQAGVVTGLALAPLIMGLNDAMVPDLLRRARDCGAQHAFTSALHLPREVKEVFQIRLKQAMPQRAGKIVSGIRDIRGGQLNDSRFGQRMGGQGPRWAAARGLFRIHAEKNGLNIKRLEPQPSTFTSPQLSLF